MWPRGPVALVPVLQRHQVQVYVRIDGLTAYASTSHNRRMPVAPTHFAHLQPHDEQLVRLGMLAERYFCAGPRQLQPTAEAVVKREGGGFTRLDRLFNGKLQEVLDSFQDHLWPAVG